MTDPFRTIPPIVALMGFAISIVAGMGASNPATSVIGRAIVALFLCLIIGQGIAWVVRHIAKEHQRDYAKRKPIPSLLSMPSEGGFDVSEVPDGKTKKS